MPPQRTLVIISEKVKKSTPNFEKMRKFSQGGYPEISTDRTPPAAHTEAGVMDMGKRPAPEQLLDLRLDPEQRLCPQFDSVCVAKFQAASEEMGVRVLDNCCEDHIM
jgi:hypothetical protein